MKPELIAFSTLALCVSLQAQAATVTYTDFSEVADVELNGVLSVPRFDTSLGTLVGVTYAITGTVFSVLGLSNVGTSPVTGTASVSVFFEVAGAALSLASSPEFSVTASTGEVTLSQDESVLFPLTASKTISGTETPGAAFELPGSIDLSFFTVTSFGGSGFGGDISISQNTDAGISFAMTYEFEADQPSPIPLPASGLALVAGLGALGIARRRLRK